MPGSWLWATHMPGSWLWVTHVPGSWLLATHVPGSWLWATHVPGSWLLAAHVPGSWLGHRGHRKMELLQPHSAFRLTQKEIRILAQTSATQLSRPPSPHPQTVWGGPRTPHDSWVAQLQKGGAHMRTEGSSQQLTIVVNYVYALYQAYTLGLYPGPIPWANTLGLYPRPIPWANTLGLCPRPIPWANTLGLYPRPVPRTRHHIVRPHSHCVATPRHHKPHQAHNVWPHQAYAPY